MPLRNGWKSWNVFHLGREEKKGRTNGRDKRKVNFNGGLWDTFCIRRRREEKIPMRLKGETFVKMDVGLRLLNRRHLCGGSRESSAFTNVQGEESQQSQGKTNNKMGLTLTFLERLCCFLILVYHFVQITTCQHVRLL